MTKPLFTVFREAMLHNPKGSRKEALDYFLERINADPAYLEILAREYFDARAKYWSATPTALGTTFGRSTAAKENVSGSVVAMPTRKEQEQRREEAKQRTESIRDQMKTRLREVLLLDLILPNGKKLRDATGAECKKAGGFFAEVAKGLKPTQKVGHHRTETDLQNIKARVFQNGKAA